jgi:hypothetical protein
MDVITLAIGVTITVATVLLAMALGGPLNRLTWRLFLKRSRRETPSSAPRAGTVSEQRNGIAVAEKGSEGNTNAAHSADHPKM